jgi:hypothetical protein
MGHGFHAVKEFCNHAVTVLKVFKLKFDGPYLNLDR